MSLQLVSDNPSAAGSAEVLLAESNHRIANNLTLIGGLLRLQAADITRNGRVLDAEAACLLLEEVSGRIETVGRLHRLLADVGQHERLDLRQYLHDIAEAAIDSMSVNGDVTLTPALSGACSIASQQALPLGFIVGELVTNAVKYAHPAGVKGQIALGCEPRPGGALLIQVSDDGVGLPEGFNPVHDGGLGMRMVRMLADQLNATLTFASGGIGVTVRLLIPGAVQPVAD